MKKRFILISIIFVISMNLILTSMVQAANPKATITVEADKTQIIVGDEITYTIFVETTEEISALDLRLDIPTGLTLIENSGTMVDSSLTNSAITSEFFEDKICVVRMDTVTLSGKVKLATFKCKADTIANGNYKIGFKLIEITAGDDDHIIPDDEYSVVNEAINIKNTKQEVEDNKDENVVEKPKDESVKEDKKKKTPKTGDNSNIILWGSICIIAGICFIIITRWNIKKVR